MNMPSDLKNSLDTLNRRGELNAGVVLNGFSDVINKYYETFDQLENSSWHEMGQVSITKNMLPEVGSWLSALESNLGVLRSACDGYNALRSMLSTLSEKISRYNSLISIDEKTDGQEREIAQLKSEIDYLIQACRDQQSYIDGLSTQIASISVDITVPGENNTEVNYKLTIADFVEEIGNNISKISGLSDIEGYSQTDERWKDLPYEPTNYGESACQPTAVATILTYCLGKEVLPTATGDVAVKSHLNNASGTIYYAGVLQGVWNGVKSTLFRDVTEETVKTELLEGHPIVYGINYKTTGHYIAVTDIDENDIVTIKDPIGELTKLPLSELIERHKEGVACVSFTPVETTVEDYNDFALLTQTNGE